MHVTVSTTLLGIPKNAWERPKPFAHAFAQP
eukprot:COSAG05_NODE_23783_length_255_cov_1.467949_1_plen_30_part_01